MQHSIVTIEGIRYWKTTIEGETEFEPIEVHPREVAVRQLSNGEWRLELVSYAKGSRGKDDIRFTEIPFLRKDAAFAALRRLIKPNRPRGGKT